MQDLFDQAPAQTQGLVIHIRGARTYRLVPKGERFGINWEEGERTGVIGGFYDGAESAMKAIQQVEAR